MNEPMVSVVMVVCNVERFLAEAIESILGQTFREFEFIIVDFGSTDQSKKIILGYASQDHRVRLHEIPHCGLAEARNAGCALARAKYIAIMDADDISLPDRLALEVDFLEKHPEVGVVGGAIEWIDAFGKPLGNSELPYAATFPRPTDNRDLQTALFDYCPLWQPSVLVRKVAFNSVGGYRGAFAPAEDYDLWLRISERFELANLGRVVLKYRTHPRQVSVRKRKQQTLRVLAAKASAAARRAGKSDPLDGIEEITPALLDSLGVSESQQQLTLAVEYKSWIETMSAAGEWSGALDTAIEMMQSCDWHFMERRDLADMRLNLARLYWKNNRYFMSVATASNAVITRPRVAGRPLTRLIRWIRASA